MNIVLCIAIYLSMPVDYNRYHTCNQDSYQPAIPNQVCVCRTTSPHSQARSVKQCVRRRICEVSYKTVQLFFPLYILLYCYQASFLPVFCCHYSCKYILVSFFLPDRTCSKAKKAFEWQPFSQFLSLPMTRRQRRR